jgi:hypothetical protein
MKKFLENIDLNGLFFGIGGTLGLIIFLISKL